MIIIVDGFDKSGRTTLAKKLGEEIGGSHIIDPIPYRRPDSLWEFISDMDFIVKTGANVVFDGSIMSDDSFVLSNDEIGVLGSFFNNNNIFLYFCHSDNYEKLKEASGLTDDMFIDHSTKTYTKFTGLHMFCPVITHDIFKTK